MTEPVETTLMGWKAWTVVGIVVFVGVLYLIGVILPEARTYIEGATKAFINTIPVINNLK